MAIRGILLTPQSFTIRLFNVIPRTHIWGEGLIHYSRSHLSLDGLVSYQDIRWRSLTPLQISSRCILQPQTTGLRWFSVISRTPVRRVLLICKEAVGVFYSPRRLGLDGLMSYPGHSLGESYIFAEKQSVYSTAPAD